MPGAPLLASPEPGSPFAWRGGQAVPAAQFLADAAQLAAQLPARGHVLNACADRYRFAVGFGAALLRAQVTLLPPDHTPETVRRLHEFAPDAYLLTDEVQAVPGLPRLDFPVLAPAAAGGGAVPELDERQLCAIVFTSGSTGAPVPNRKHWGALVRNVRGALERWGTPAGRTAILGTVPPQHMYGFESTVLAALQGGGALCAERPFYPDDVCAALERLPRPRVLVTTPFHLRSLLEDVARPPAADLLLCATAPLDAALAQLAEARFGAALLEIYGSTETGQMATRRTALEPQWRTLPGVRVEAREGRAWASGGHVERPTALGDVIEVQSPERFLLQGRVSDMVNVAGKRSSLAFLNAQLLAIEGVRDGVFHLPDEAGAGGITRLCAFVVAPGMSREQVLAQLRRRIDTAFLPRPLVLLERLPRAATGKLTREALLALARSPRARLHFAASHPAFAGHFPGAPMVPGALLLAEALAALGLEDAGLEIASAKFLHPVGPDCDVDVHCDPARRLELHSSGRLVATANLRTPPA
jgi:acyl-coenzyme A synthetase/AMP-(fatty) acid ligase